MSRFLKYLPLPTMCVGLLFWVSGCCMTEEEVHPLTIKFIILDQAGENVLLSNSLPQTVIWYYRENAIVEAVNPYPDYSNGAFVMDVLPGNNYRIDILNKSFVTLDVTYTKQKEQCRSYETISGMSVNGVAWDYHTNPILTLVYNP